MPPRGPRSLRAFDPHRTADLETAMWKAFYERHDARLFVLLVRLLHDQYHYSRARVVQAGFHFARAAATFGRARSRRAPAESAPSHVGDLIAEEYAAMRDAEAERPDWGALRRCWIGPLSAWTTPSPLRKRRLAVL